MAFNNITSRTDAGALISEDVSKELLGGIEEYSAAFNVFRKINVSSKQTRFPVLSAFPLAYWVDGDTGLKQTTEMAWSNKYITMEKLAVVVPVSMDLYDDLMDGEGFDLWSEALPHVREAIGRKVDEALFFGIDKPATQPDALATAAIAAGNTVVRGTATKADGGLAEDINQLFGKVEADGFGVNTFITDSTFRTRLRGARATDGQKLLDISTNSLDGVDITYGLDGAWPTGANAVEAFAGDRNKVIVGIRKDFYWDVWKEAVIQDSTGAIVYNLAQQNLFGLVVEFRCGWTYSNPINRRQPTEAQRFPFAVLQAPAV